MPNTVTSPKGKVLHSRARITREPKKGSGAREIPIKLTKNNPKEIVICLDSETLELFDDKGDSLFKTQVVTGCTSNETRTGTYTAKSDWISNKPYKPETGAEIEGWDKDKSNPYGPWFLKLYDSSGKYSTYGIHGRVGAGDTTSPTVPFSSLTPESWYWKCSHGCTRTSNLDIQKLHELIPHPIGLKIIIKKCNQ